MTGGGGLGTGNTGPGMTVLRDTFAGIAGRDGGGFLLDLALRNSGAGLGVFLGILIGLGVRRMSGRPDGQLVAGSILLTALAAGLLALAAMMLFSLLWSGGA